MNEEQTRMSKHQKVKTKKLLLLKLLIGISSICMIIVLIFSSLYLWKAEQINGAISALDTETKFENTASPIDHTKGILLIAIDDDGQGNVEQGHTDGLTYVGINTETQEIMMMPIYRDARIPVVCDNHREENINRILQQTSLNCLVESAAEFLNLPIDYYVETSTGGFLQAVERVGTISVTSEETFCNGNYCFETGQTYDMTAEMALKYARYRGATSGLNRANRQLTIIKGVMDQCMSNPMGCFDQVSPILGEIIQTNFPISEFTKYLGLISSNLHIEQLEVIQGTNTQLADGWTQIVDQADLATKTEVIRSRIFE